LFLYTLIFTFLDIKMEHKIFCTEWQQEVFRDFSLLSTYGIWFDKCVAKYWKCSLLLKDLSPIFMLLFCPAFWSRDITIYKVVQTWPGQTVTCLHTNHPGHIWTTLYLVFSAYTSKPIS
jgi:hypothetical protein